MQEYDELVKQLRAKVSQLNDKQQFWVGIAGAPGSGKSTLAFALQQRLERLAIVIPMDGYHYYRSELDAMDDPEQAHARRGAPFTFNATKFVNDLIQAKSLGEGSFASFDHSVGDPIENDIQLAKSHRIVLVEGNYLLLNEEPWQQLHKAVFDESWYLGLALKESKQRLIKRHVDVGLSEAQAIQRFMSSDGLNAELIEKESPQNADSIIMIGEHV